jgi:hypothetical protein
VAKKRMTCMVPLCGRTLRRKACPVHGRGAMVASRAVKSVLTANAAGLAKAAAGGGTVLAKQAGEDLGAVRALMVRQMEAAVAHDPAAREGARRQRDAWMRIPPGGGRPS